MTPELLVVGDLEAEHALARAQVALHGRPAPSRLQREDLKRAAAREGIADRGEELSVARAGGHRGGRPPFPARPLEGEELRGGAWIAGALHDLRRSSERFGQSALVAAQLLGPLGAERRTGAGARLGPKDEGALELLADDGRGPSASESLAGRARTHPVQGEEARTATGSHQVEQPARALVLRAGGQQRRAQKGVLVVPGGQPRTEDIPAPAHGQDGQAGHPTAFILASQHAQPTRSHRRGGGAYEVGVQERIGLCRGFGELGPAFEVGAGQLREGGEGRANVDFLCVAGR